MQSLMHVQTSRDGIIARRGFLRTVAFGALGGGLLGWKDAVALHADELRKLNLSCILLFMRGGPSQFETFDPKPDTANGGPTKAIATSVPGIQVAEGWEKVAQQMNDLALVRSVTSKEGEHQRAAYQLHTGYVPTGSVKYPSIGSVVASELAPKDFDLPHFVSVGNRGMTIGAGFLGMSFAPFVVANPNQVPNNATLPQGVNETRFSRRLGLLGELEKDFAEAGGGPRVQDHKAIYGNAEKMILSPRMKAFDLAQEKDAVRERYGRTAFGQGCLLARRLVEEGVTFVEVELTGWDTHDDNFNRTKNLTQVADPAFAALLGDLKERGRLGQTLVIWIGEFGRTPRINPKTGRDHFPKAFNVALAGAGIRGGQVIGATSGDGTEVKSRPVTVPELFCTFYKALQINPRKENMSTLGRPIKLMDKGEAVKELFTA
jgi:uncharacterized protein (DUF1501 family)